MSAQVLNTSPTRMGRNFGCMFLPMMRFNALANSKTVLSFPLATLKISCLMPGVVAERMLAETTFST